MPNSPPPQPPPSGATTVRAAIEHNLRREFAPERLTIIDESHRHEGHSGSRPGGETHFRIEIVSAAFAGISRVERQRRVYRALAAQLADRVHALALSALAPGEKATPA